VTRPLAMDLDAAESKHLGWRFAADDAGVVATHTRIPAEVRGDDLAEAEAKVTRIDGTWDKLRSAAERMSRNPDAGAYNDREGEP
jgi:hypothetical protein